MRSTRHSGRSSGRGFLALSATTLALFCLSCEAESPAERTLGPAVLQISANPTAMPVIGGSSTITIVGHEVRVSLEQVPLNGQVILTTNVGSVAERVLVVNGVGQATLRSLGRAGLASVTATAIQGGTATLDPPVLIGNAEGLNIVLTANPATVVAPDLTSELLATAFDNDNNPMQDVPIIFDASAGATASQGSILRTNVLGQVFDRFELRDAGSASVVARSGSVVSNTVAISQ